MSVLATLDFGTSKWAFSLEPESFAIDIEIGFKNNGEAVEKFDRFSFGLAVVSNGLPVLTKAYPPQGVRYIASDQTYLTNDRVNLAPDDKVIVAVWAKNAGQRYEGHASFVVPRPPQPLSE